MPRIDNLVMFRSVQVTRRLQLKSRESACSAISPAHAHRRERVSSSSSISWTRTARCPTSLILEFTQNAYADVRPDRDGEPVGACRARLPFLMDHVADLRLEPRELAERSFRFLKVPAKLLLNRGGGAERHPSRGFGRPARALRHRPRRRADREREHGARFVGLRRALRSGFPVLPAAAGTQRGARHDRRAGDHRAGGVTDHPVNVIARRHSGWPAGPTRNPLARHGPFLDSGFARLRSRPGMTDRCPRSSHIFPNSPPATTSSSATFGAWCITACRRLRRPATR